MRLGSSQVKHRDEKDLRPGAKARRKDRERFMKRHRDKMRRQMGSRR